MEDEYLCFGVFVKENIIDEDNNYRVEYRRMYTNVERTYKGTFTEFFEKSSMLKEMGITGDYKIYLDMNNFHGVMGSCQMIPIISDDALMFNTADTPFKGANAKTRHIQIVPEEERWIKKVLLDEAQIEQAIKLMSDIEEQPFTKKRKLV